jgi:hypothetical protein
MRLAPRSDSRDGRSGGQRRCGLSSDPLEGHDQGRRGEDQGVRSEAGPVPRLRHDLGASAQVEAEPRRPGRDEGDCSADEQEHEGDAPTRTLTHGYLRGSAAGVAALDYRAGRCPTAGGARGLQIQEARRVAGAPEPQRTTDEAERSSKTTATAARARGVGSVRDPSAFARRFPETSVGPWATVTSGPVGAIIRAPIGTSPPLTLAGPPSIDGASRRAKSVRDETAHRDGATCGLTSEA